DHRGAPSLAAVMAEAIAGELAVGRDAPDHVVRSREGPPPRRLQPEVAVGPFCDPCAIEGDPPLDPTVAVEGECAVAKRGFPKRPVATRGEASPVSLQHRLANETEATRRIDPADPMSPGEPHPTVRAAYQAAQSEPRRNAKGERFDRAIRLQV